jgi:hypothetical protein
MPTVWPLGAAQKILKLQSWRAANVHCQKVMCLTKKKPWQRGQIEGAPGEVYDLTFLKKIIMLSLKRSEEWLLLKLQIIFLQSAPHLKLVYFLKTKLGLFYHTTAQLLFLSHVCCDIQTPVSFLTTRVYYPDEDDWGKLKHISKYL